MDALDAIHTRRSIRKYEDKPVPEELLEAVLSAAMSAPSACNAQPWHFVVITDRAVLKQVPKINPHAAMAADAPAAILVCGDVSLELSSGYWVVDCSAAVENLLLAAHALGLGAVWTGIYPRDDRMQGFSQLLNLPQNVIPHSLIPLGYPAEQPPRQDRYKKERVHFDRWSA